MKNAMRTVFICMAFFIAKQNAFFQKWKDFEDCVQYMTGKNNESDYIITVNRKDYKEDSLPVLTPASWMEKMAGLEKE